MTAQIPTRSSKLSLCLALKFAVFSLVSVSSESWVQAEPDKGYFTFDFNAKPALAVSETDTQTPTAAEAQAGTVPLAGTDSESRSPSETKVNFF
jgi:hypothetical protein